MLKYPAILLFLAIILVAAIAILMLHNNANVGGILSKVLGFLGGKRDEIESANSVPVDRNVALGEADKNGFVQHKVSELESSLNPFRDKTTIKLPSGKKIKLPQGVKDTDVDRIIETETEIQIIPNEENYERARKAANIIKRSSATSSKAKDLVARLRARQ